VRGEPRYVSGLRRLRKPQPRFRRGREADACRTGSTAHPWCRCTRASSAACWGQATWSMSSPTSAEPALLAVAPRRQHGVRAMNADRPTCRRAPSRRPLRRRARQPKKQRRTRGPLASASGARASGESLGCGRGDVTRQGGRGAVGGIPVRRCPNRSCFRRLPRCDATVGSSKADDRPSRSRDEADRPLIG
jgi:hypothetical protein